MFTALTPGTTITGRAAGGHVGSTGALLEHFNTRGGIISEKSGPGEYKVGLLGLGAQQRGGTVQVTAFDVDSTDASHCKVAHWGPDSAATMLIITVKCFSHDTNDPGDSAFNFLYDEEIPAPNNRGAYAYANDPIATTPYQPATTWTFSRGPRLSDTSNSARGSRLTDVAEGHYKMVHRGPREADAKKSYAFVGAYGTGAEYCKIRSWGMVAGCTADCDIEVITQCYRQGQVKNSRYVQTWGSFRNLIVLE